MRLRLGHIASHVTIVGSEPRRFVALEHIGAGTGQLLGEDDLDRRDPEPTGMVAFEPGDVLFGKLRPYLRKAWRATFPGLCSSELIVMRAQDGIDHRWLGYLAQSDVLVGWAIATSDGVKMPRTAWEKLRLVELDVPPVVVQRATADYLDATAREIDGLLQARRRLADLLRERRRILIMTLTAQGTGALLAPRPITPWPPAELPSGWSLAQIRHLARVGRGASPRPIDDPAWFHPDGRYGWVRISDVTASSRYLESTEQRLSEAGAARSVKLEPGALILSIAASVGNPIITRIPCCVHDGFVYFAGLRSLEPEYLYYLLLGGGMFGGLGKLGTQLNLNTDTIGDIRVPVPSREEQRAIVATLDEKLTGINAAISLANRQVALLSERRHALITAAVTGQRETSGVAA